MHDIFLHFKNNLSDISRITYALLSSSKLHASATADNLIIGIDRRIHAKTPDIFEILSTVQKVGLSMVYEPKQRRYYGNERHCPEMTFVLHVVGSNAWRRTEHFQNGRDCCRLTTDFVFLLLW